jgi:alkylated DNA nucleotide flippase Atl1
MSQTDFKKQVLEVIAQIPEGHVMTYLRSCT